MQQSERKRGDPGGATTTHSKRESPKAAPPAQAPTRATEGFLNVLVTPKISFSLPRRPHWQTPEDIGQDDLREAFLSRFPVRFDSSKLVFVVLELFEEVGNYGIERQTVHQGRHFSQIKL